MSMGDQSYTKTKGWQDYVQYLTKTRQTGTLGALATQDQIKPSANTTTKKTTGRGSGVTVKKNPPLNLKVYNPLGYNPKGLMKRATTQADAMQREGLAASQMKRNSADSMYRNNVRVLDFNQERDIGQQNDQRYSNLAMNSNTALNRGMGYGQGYLNTQTSTNLGADKLISDIQIAAAMQRQNALDTRNTEFSNMDEQDRVLRENRIAKIEELFAQYDDTAYNRYLKNEALRQVVVDSRNNALTANYNSRY